MSICWETVCFTCQYPRHIVQQPVRVHIQKIKGGHFKPLNGWDINLTSVLLFHESVHFAFQCSILTSQRSHCCLNYSHNSELAPLCKQGTFSSGLLSPHFSCCSTLLPWVSVLSCEALWHPFRKDLLKSSFQVYEKFSWSSHGRLKEACPFIHQQLFPFQWFYLSISLPPLFIFQTFINTSSFHTINTHLCPLILN